MPPLPDSVTSSIEVHVSQAFAFNAYTTQISEWFLDTEHSWLDPSRAKKHVLETHLGGRLMEIYDEKTGDGYVFAKVTEWSPPQRFVLLWSHHDEGYKTEVVVDFIRLAEKKTRVQIEHRGWSQLPDHIAEKGVGSVRHGWPAQLKWFAEFIDAR